MICHEKEVKDMLILNCGKNEKEEEYKHFQHLHCLIIWLKGKRGEKRCVMCNKEFDWRNCKSVKILPNGNI